MKHNRIREFTSNLKSDFIITGSYLGRVLKKEVKYSAGDLDSLDLYGNSGADSYQKMEELFHACCKIGGYPAVVLKYLESRSEEECQTELLKIIHLFIHESKRYFG